MFSRARASASRPFCLPFQYRAIVAPSSDSRRLAGRWRTAPSVSECGSATGVTMRSSADRVAAWVIDVSLRISVPVIAIDSVARVRDRHDLDDLVWIARRLRLTHQLL